jgi:hypothetical protein
MTETCPQRKTFTVPSIQRNKHKTFQKPSNEETGCKDKILTENIPFLIQLSFVLLAWKYEKVIFYVFFGNGKQRNY